MAILCLTPPGPRLDFTIPGSVLCQRPEVGRRRCNEIVSLVMGLHVFPDLGDYCWRTLVASDIHTIVYPPHCTIVFMFARIDFYGFSVLSTSGEDTWGELRIRPEGRFSSDCDRAYGYWWILFRSRYLSAYEPAEYVH